MKILQKNEIWMLIFSIGMLYWLFNPSVPMTLVMIVPLLIATTSKKYFLINFLLNYKLQIIIWLKFIIIILDCIN